MKKFSTKTQNRLNQAFANAIINRLKGGLPFDKGFSNELKKIKGVKKSTDFVKEQAVGFYIASFKQQPDFVWKFKELKKKTVEIPTSLKGTDTVIIKSDTPYDGATDCCLANIFGIDQDLIDTTDDEDVCLIHGVDGNLLLARAIKELSIYGIESFDRLDDEVHITLNYA